MSHPDWITIRRGAAPLVLSLPHTGTDLRGLEPRLVSPWLARKDADWWLETLYGFAAGLDATLVRTTVSRTVIDVNRDPSGVSLYPGQATTELCPSTTFDGEALYRAGEAPEAAEIAERRAAYFDPYHAALAGEIERLAALHHRVVLYDCHSIRSEIPRLFDGLLPNFNIGTNSGASCDGALAAAVEAACDSADFTRVTNGRFKGGYITRHYGAPVKGVHAIQMELACRGYMREPVGPIAPGTAAAEGWPAPFDAAYAAPVSRHLAAVLDACLAFARS